MKKQNKKVRKVELIMYGYGTKQIFELDNINLQVDYPAIKEGLKELKKLGKEIQLPKRETFCNFNLNGKIIKMTYQGRNYLSKLKKRRKENDN